VVQTADGAHDEAPFPAEQPASQADPRIPRTHGHEGRSARAEPAPRQGAQAPRGLKPTTARAAESSEHGFPRSRRLTEKREFDALYGKGWRSGDAYFLVIARENALGHARLGLSVGVRAAGNAVARNRLKRLLREWFRVQQSATPACDIVVNVRPAAAGAANDVLARSLHGHWEKLRQRCGRS
jgi:ribonuclease P protein component